MDNLDIPLQGYAVDFAYDVQASFVIPSFKLPNNQTVCPAQAFYQALIWPGIGGAGDLDDTGWTNYYIFQAGAWLTLTCSGPGASAQPRVTLWEEFYPQQPTLVPVTLSSGQGAGVGDVITIQIKRVTTNTPAKCTPDLWCYENMYYSISDGAKGMAQGTIYNSYTGSTCKEKYELCWAWKSAEAIVERVAYQGVAGAFYPLPDVGTVSFSNAWRQDDYGGPDGLNMMIPMTQDWIDQGHTENNDWTSIPSDDGCDILTPAFSQGSMNITVTHANTGNPRSGISGSSNTGAYCAKGPTSPSPAAGFCYCAAERR